MDSTQEEAVFTQLPRIVSMVKCSNCRTVDLWLPITHYYAFFLASELCNLCVSNDVVFPSLEEAFEEGMRLLAVYMVFHDYFLKSSIGDAAWKEACLDAADPSD
jgi:hypothetical protein